jgi:alpha-1,6-mannosyltransferase
MLRICDFNTFYSPQGGGVRAYLERKLDFFSRRNDAAYSLIVPGEGNSLSPAGRARFYTIASHPVPGASQYRYVVTPRELRRVLKAEMPHVIEVGAPYWSPWLARMAARGLGARLVGFWHAAYPSARRALPRPSRTAHRPGRSRSGVVVRAANLRRLRCHLRRQPTCRESLA